MQKTGLLLGFRAAPARAAAALAMILGLASLCGWLFDVHALTCLLPGGAEMKVNTAVAVVLCGIALLVQTAHPSLSMQRTAQALSILVAIVGLTTLAEYFFGIELGIDELVLPDPNGAFNVFRGRMSPFSAAAFVAIGLSLAALPVRRLYAFATSAASIAVLVGVTSLIGYLWNADELVTDRWLPPVALNTAACFAFLGGGVFFVPRDARALDKKLAALPAAEIRIVVGFVATMSLLMLGGSYTYRTNDRFARSLNWVAHTQEFRASAASMYGSLAGAEVALRDYILTADEVNRSEYRLLTADVIKNLNNLESLTVDNPAQQRNLSDLRPIVEGRLAAMRSAYTAFHDFGLAAARAVLSNTREINTTREVRARTEALEATEVSLLTARRKMTAAARATTLLSLLATLAVASGLFVALFRGIHREMLARREAEDALRVSARYNRSVLDSSPDCLGVLTLDGHLTQMTPHGMKLMEIDSFDSVANTQWTNTWTGVHRTSAATALENARHGADGRFQGFCPTLKGSPKWWDVIVKPVLGADGKPQRLLAVARDITEVKKVEDELRALNRFFDSLFESLPLMVYVKDARTLRYVRLNKECERNMGLTREQMIGKTARDLMTASEADCVEARDREVISHGKLVEIPEDTVSTEEFGQRTRHTMKLPIFDEVGAPQYLLGISVDITERKLAETAIRELNAALLAKATQLESTNEELESFTYSVSHDLRAPLRAIDGFALMIEEDYKDRLDAEGHRYLAVIRENSKRMGELIDDLLSFSRLARLPVASREINVEGLVKEVVAEALSLHAQPTPQITIGPLPPALGDRSLLRQAWANLIANAIKYSSKRAVPRIEVCGRREGQEILYSVKDNGVGFSMEYVEKLFRVFQRLHRADEFSGTGVGLAIVHRVVTRHGGRVWAEGRLDQGAEFSFALPAGTVDA